MKGKKDSRLPYDALDVGDAIIAAQRMAAKLLQGLPRPWAQQNLRTETGHQLDFTERPWLEQLYDDPHPRIDVQKCAQVGMTTWGCVQALHRVVVHGETGIFTMPTEGDIRDLVSGRIDSIIDNSPALSALIDAGEATRRPNRRRPVDNTGVKRLGRGILYFRGTQTEHGAASIPADIIVHDEIDLSQPEVLEMFEHRLDAHPPAERRIFALSTPTVPGYGISARVEASDAREWIVSCEGCSWSGVLDYWLHTRGELSYLCCHKCGRRLNPLRGRWVAAHPGRDTHGYRVSRLLLAVPGRPDILDALHQRRTEARYTRHFLNMDLGLPSSDGTDRISRERILGACFKESYPMSQYPELGTGPYVMGIDQGDTLTVVIGRADPLREEGRVRVIYMARLRDPNHGSGAWAAVAELIERFNVRYCIVDGNSNRANAYDLARRFLGRVFLCNYKERRNGNRSRSPNRRRSATWQERV